MTLDSKNALLDCPDTGAGDVMDDGYPPALRIQLE